MIAEMSGSTVLRRYIHGPGVDDPLIWYEGAGTSDRRYLHADERGSIVAVTNDAGGVIARNTYDEWGVPAATNIGRFQYTGQQWLPEIGLHYYKARFYNPRLGRFMQTDPIGYEDGMNLYAYVGNDPMNAADPKGEEAACITLGGTCTDPNLSWSDIGERALTTIDFVAVGIDLVLGGPTGESAPILAITAGARQSLRSLVAASRAERSVSRIGARSGVLNRRHYRAAMREARGEVVTRRPDGRPFDHINELRESVRGLRNDLRQAQRDLRSRDLSRENAERLRESVRRGQRQLDEANSVLSRVESCTGTRICR